jgi:hypothetical protein
MKRRKRKTRWKNFHYITIYELAKAGFTKAKIAKVLGVTIVTFYKWWNTKPTVRKAYLHGKKMAKSVETFRGYAYRRLSPKLRKIWDRVNAADSKGAGTERVEQILKDAGKKARQHLFVYAWTACGFNPTEACRVLCMDRQTFEGWYKNDPEFHQLFDAMNEIKKDFFEAPLIYKVGEGDINAILFANRTYNADRGYGNKMQVEHSGSVQHTINVVPVKELNLPLEVRKSIYESMQERKEDILALENRRNGNGHTIED